jgi:hypothetical protein
VFYAAPDSLSLDLSATLNGHFMPGFPSLLTARMLDCFGNEMVAYRSPVALLPLAAASTAGCLVAVAPSSRVVIVAGQASFQLSMATSEGDPRCNVEFRMEDATLAYLAPSPVAFTGGQCFPGKRPNAPHFAFSPSDADNCPSHFVQATSRRPATASSCARAARRRPTACSSPRLNATLVSCPSLAGFEVLVSAMLSWSCNCAPF